MHPRTLTLRLATPADTAALTRLVELEEADRLIGDVLLAELDGRVLAAVSMVDGRKVADIFKPTADVVRMLRDWRSQALAARGPAPAPRRVRVARRRLALQG